MDLLHQEHIDLQSIAELEEPRRNLFRGEKPIYSDGYAKAMAGQLQSFGDYSQRDIAFALGFTLLGFLISQFFKDNKRKEISLLSSIFERLNSLEEQLVQKEQRRMDRIAHLKFFEKFYLVLEIVFLLWCWRSPALPQYLKKQFFKPILWAIVLIVPVPLSYYYRNWLVIRNNRISEERTKIQSKMIDHERDLVNKLDPKVYNMVEKVVLKQKRREIEEQRYSKDGCTKKCRANSQILKIDIERKSKLTDKLLEHQWCDMCKLRRKLDDKGALACKSGCGNRLYNQCAELVEDYYARDAKIEDLQKKLKFYEQRESAYNELKEKQNAFEIFLRQDTEQMEDDDQ